MRSAPLSSAEIAARILPLQNVLIAAHYNPDADAYGSSLGLGLGLRALGKRAAFVNETALVARYRTLPAIAEVQNEVPGGDFEALIACDCGDEKRLGDRLKSDLLRLPLVFNIDHHRSNSFFGAYNCVEADAGSASEIVFDVLEELGRLTGKSPFTKDAATWLFAGIMGDTGSFRYSSTTPKTFETARRLVEYGAEPAVVGEVLYGRARPAAVRLHAEALRGLELSHGGKVALVVVNARMLAGFGATADDTEELVEKARDIDGVEVAVFIREEDGYWKTSLRSKNPAHDLSRIAAAFGGGGHLSAAGFRWRGSYQELRARLAAELDNLLAPGGALPV